MQGNYQISLANGLKPGTTTTGSGPSVKRGLIGTEARIIHEIMAADSGLETDNVPVQSLSVRRPTLPTLNLKSPSGTSSLVILKSKKHFHARGELLLHRRPLWRSLRSGGAAGFSRLC